MPKIVLPATKRENPRNPVAFTQTFTVALGVDWATGKRGTKSLYEIMKKVQKAAQGRSRYRQVEVTAYY
jgi:hypothetical protein